jgi:hypothetical protein
MSLPIDATQGNAPPPSPGRGPTPEVPTPTDPTASHPPMTHAELLHWCHARHPDAGVPEADCPGALRLAGVIGSEGLGLPHGAEVRVLVCAACGAELAVGRGANPLAAALAPRLDGLLLWISRPGVDRFSYRNPDFEPGGALQPIDAGDDHDHDHDQAGAAPPPGPAPGRPAAADPGPLPETPEAVLAELRRLGRRLDDAAIGVSRVALDLPDLLDRLERSLRRARRPRPGRPS